MLRARLRTISGTKRHGCFTDMAIDAGEAALGALNQVPGYTIRTIRARVSEKEVP